MRPFDTSPAAEQQQLKIFRSMLPEVRLQMAMELSQTCRHLLAEGVRLRHPDYDNEKVRLAVIRLLLGDELFLTVYPEARDIIS